MNILVTNDDGIAAPGLWTLCRALKKVAHVIAVAPDRERSAIGTAVTLRQPLKVERTAPLVPGIESYSVDGTPGDSVILALTHLLVNDVDLVISGINHGANVGDDVLISGTVGGALQGYLHGYASIAISVAAWENPYLDSAAELAALLVKRLDNISSSQHILLNINVPSLPSGQIKDLQVSRLAHISHTSTIKEENATKDGYYRLLRQKIDKPADAGTDVWTIEHDNISITPLHTIIGNNRSPSIIDTLFSGLLHELQEQEHL